MNNLDAIKMPLDLNLIKYREIDRHEHEEGTFVRHLKDAAAADSIPALVAEVERQAATIAKAIEAMDAIPRSMYAEDVVRILRTGSVLIGPPVTRSSDFSNTGGQL